MNKLSPIEVKEAREALGMTQRQLADALLLESKFSKDTVRSWESGMRPCPGPESVAIQLMVKLKGRKAARQRGDVAATAGG